MGTFRTALLFGLFCLMALAGYASAQSRVVWREFAPEGEEFQTEAPEGLVRPAPPGDKACKFYRARSGQAFFYVYTSHGTKNDAMDAELKYLLGYQTAGKSEPRGQLLVDRFSFDDEDGFHHEAMTFRTQRGRYLFHTLSDVPNDKQIARFYDKLSIGKVNDSYPSLEPLAYMEDEPATLKLARSENTAATSVVILEKPRPGYTYEARQRSISGTIVIRVQFLADGTIGKVTPVKGLPYGLTRQVIEAARRMTFHPATIDGKPVDIEKQLEYTFSIY